ncbi:MAG: hypothetical protein IKP81_10990 [Paludibacteraceae bacterium]|nr:hypothetical protein [Paludibacteraceae bacterium]
MKIKHLLLSVCALAGIVTGSLTSCDDGNIRKENELYLDAGYVVKLNGTLSNMDQWGSKYQIVVAAFAAQDSYPLLAKSLPVTEKTQDFKFESINPDCDRIELCVLNLINKRVATLATLYNKAEDPDHKLTDTIYFKAEGLDAGMFANIQKNIFSKRCAYCHGMGETPAAGLYLTEGNSYASLVGVTSKKIDSLKRVDPNNAKGSMLYKVLTEYGDDCGWHYNHTNFFYGDAMSNLVKEWINNGAPE